MAETSTSQKKRESLRALAAFLRRFQDAGVVSLSEMRLILQAALNDGILDKEAYSAAGTARVNDSLNNFLNHRRGKGLWRTIPGCRFQHAKGALTPKARKMLGLPEES